MYSYLSSFHTSLSFTVTYAHCCLSYRPHCSSTSLKQHAVSPLQIMFFFLLLHVHCCFACIPNPFEYLFLHYCLMRMIIYQMLHFHSTTSTLHLVLPKFAVQLPLLDSIHKHLSLPTPLSTPILLIFAKMHMFSVTYAQNSNKGNEDILC